MKRLYTAIRTVIKAVRTGKIQLIDVKGRGEDFTDKELFQQYGHASRPLPESEGILLYIGGADNAIVIATEDRRYRIALEEGEVAIYSDEGDKVHLKRNKIIEVVAGEKITALTKVAEITATTKTTVTSPEVEIVAGSKVTMNTPTAEITGNLTVGGNITAVGNITASGNIADAGGAKTMSGMRSTYNSHTHSHPSDGVTIPATGQSM